MITRYQPCPSRLDEADMIEDAEGEYVDWDDYQRLQSENTALREALQELCDLKALKDARGKTNDYYVRQPTAWVTARALLEPQETEEPKP